MDNVTTSKYQTNDKVGPTTSEDPKSFICDHNAMRSGLVDVIVHQSQRQASIEKDQTGNKKKLDELQHFFNEYGKKHPENIVTLKMDDYHRRKWDLKSELESDLGFIKKDLSNLRKKLKKLEENAHQLDCLCLKAKI